MTPRKIASADRRAILVTGYPGYIGKRLVAKIADSERQADIYLLVQPKFMKDARRYANALPKARGNRLHLLAGDIVDMHLGLSGTEYREMVSQLTDIFHLAAVSYLGAGRSQMFRVNVEGTRNVIELARDAQKLTRLCHFSSCYVAGDRTGVVAEDELEEGQRFRNAYEESKYEAERLIRRAQSSLPATILRPSAVIGDSQTGEIDRFEGPYYLAIQLATSPLNVPLPLPLNADAPLHVVPVDYVVDAAHALARDPRAVGKTFHLVDPSPMSSRRIYQLLADRTQRKVRHLRAPPGPAGALLRLPGLEKLLRPQRTALEYANQMVFYRAANTLELLDGSGLRCPQPTAYLDTLVRFVRETARRRRDERIEDPLDRPAESSPPETTGLSPGEKKAPAR
ncbi:MAG: SDR family oxidoreductase [Deltaproteobacteria bacterium]